MLVPKPGESGTVYFAKFDLAGLWFSAMDGGTSHEFAFTPGLSPEASFADQVENDKLREPLSEVPAAERCGRPVGRFGFSWQVVPQNMRDLMKNPGAYQRMLGMKRIIISELCCFAVTGIELAGTLVGTE